MLAACACRLCLVRVWPHTHVLCSQEAAKLEAALEKLRQEAAAAAAAAESKGAAAAQAAAAAERF